MHEDVSGVKTLLLLICVNKTVANGTKLLTGVHKIGCLFIGDCTERGRLMFTMHCAKCSLGSSISN